MGIAPLNCPVSDFRQDAAGVIRLAASGGPVYVTQRGRKTAVLLSRLSFGRLRREHETLTRAAVGDLGVPLGEGLALDEIFTRGERALAGQRSVAAAECAAATVEEVDETDFNWPPAWCRTIGDE